MPIFIHTFLCCIKTTQMKTSEEGEYAAGPVLGHSMLCHVLVSTWNALPRFFMQLILKNVFQNLAQVLERWLST